VMTRSLVDIVFPPMETVFMAHSIDRGVPV
jgi:hypothetical protein